MWFRSRPLRPHEEVIFDARPHGLVLGRPVVVTVVVLAGAVVAGVRGVPPVAVWLVVGVLVASLVWLLSRYVRWASTRLVLTTDRLIHRRGVLARTVWEVPLDKLSDLRSRQSLAGRLVGMGDLEVECAGRDGAELLSGISRPEAVRARIDEQVAALRGHDGTAVSIPEQIRQLAELVERGVVTRAEFEAKKAQLLDRL